MEILRMKMFVALLCLVAVLGFAPLCSGARVLVENEFGANPQKNSGFYTKIKFLVADDIRVPCEEGENERRPSATGDMSGLTFKFNENRTRDVAKVRSGESGKMVYSILPKGPVTPSGPSPKHNGFINGERLSKSKPSPAVGHMQISGKKRTLRSTPSQGAGH
ncbi:hypothetical protein SUGI_0253630 [Cryptomeria japonica]|nr:hypothetical protein SUGI_0253630 [Cryptomeria japonica]